MRERCSKNYVLHRSYWVLKGATREFYICTTAGPSDWRTALCIFDSKTGAGGYLRSLGEPQAFLGIMQSYGMQIPGWMRREPQLSEMHEATTQELRRVMKGVGVVHVTLNPPPVELPDAWRSGVPELLPLKRLEELSRRGDIESFEARQPQPDRYGRAG